jgi:O-antigen ligase
VTRALRLARYEFFRGRSPWPIVALAALVLVVALALALLPLRFALPLTLGGGLALVALIDPVWALYALVLSVPIQEVLLLPAGVTYTQAVAALALGVWLLRVLAYPERHLPQSGVLVAGALFLLALLAATAFAPYGFANGLRESSRWAVVFLVYLLTLHTVRDERRAWGLVACLLLAPTLAALPGLVQFVTADGPPSFEIMGGRFVRAYSTFGTPNTFGGYMNMAWPLAAALLLALLLQKNKPTSKQADRELPLIARMLRFLISPVNGLLVLSGGIIGAGLLASFSRGAWLGAVAAGLLLVALSGRRFALGVAVALLLGVSVALAGETQLLPQGVAERVQSIVANIRIFDVSTVAVTPANFAIVERMAHWQAGARMFLDHPLLGVGAGNFNAAYGDYFVGPWPDSRGHAHNYYIHIAAEAGLLGLVAYLALLATLASQVLRALRVVAAGVWRGVIVGVCGIMVAVAVHNIFENVHVLNMGIQLAACWGLLAAATRRGLASE